MDGEEMTDNKIVYFLLRKQNYWDSYDTVESIVYASFTLSKVEDKKRMLENELELENQCKNCPMGTYSHCLPISVCGGELCEYDKACHQFKVNYVKNNCVRFNYSETPTYFFDSHCKNCYFEDAEVKYEIIQVRVEE